MSGYWFRDDPVPRLIRPVSTVFECGDWDVLERIVSVEVVS